MAFQGAVAFLLALAVPCLASTGKGLLIIDVQDCFLEGGSLAVNAKHIIPVINYIRDEKDCLFDIVVRSQDFHPSGHISFGSTNGLPDIGAGTPIPMKCIKPESGKTTDAACCPDAAAADAAIKANIEAKVAEMTDNPACTTCFSSSTADQCFEMQQAMWPDHCLQDGDATFPGTLTKKTSDVIAQKGSNKFVDAYSAFMDNTKTLKTDLERIFKDAGVSELYVMGIATDFCVKWSATDAVDLGFKVNVVTDASAGIGIPIDDSSTTITVGNDEMKQKGVTMVESDSLLGMECPSTSAPGQEASEAVCHSVSQWAMMVMAFIAVSKV
jgi:nicotinamidase-related amidase